MKSNISTVYRYHHHHHHHSKSARTTTTTKEESAISPSLLAFLAVTFLLNTYNLRSRPWALAFVAGTYSNLLLLFWCIETHHKAPRGSRRRKRLRAAVCVLSNTLIVTITCRVAGMMPLAVKVLAWAMTGATVSGTTYGFFVYCPKHEDNYDDEVAAGTRAAAALEP